MQITCPECRHEQMIDDDQAGAPVACEACRHRFHVEQDGNIQEGLPPAKSRPAGQAKRDPRDRSRDDLPVGSSSGSVIAIVIGSVLLVFFLLCGVGALGGFFFAFLGARQEHEAVRVAEEMQDEARVAVANKPGIKQANVLPEPNANAAADALERIRNGDFEQGHKGFRTQYQYSPRNVRADLAYDILRNPRDAHPEAAKFGDNTTGKGNMLMVNGGQAIDRLVWGQTTDVQPGAEYALSLSVASWSAFAPTRLDVRINGKSIGQITTLQQTGEWKGLRVPWNSGPDKAAAIEIYDLNQAAAGNDFAIDDISLRGPAPQ